MTIWRFLRNEAAVTIYEKLHVVKHETRKLQKREVEQVKNVLGVETFIRFSGVSWAIIELADRVATMLFD